MTKEEWKREQEEDDDFGFRLASLSRRNTGLPMVIFIDTMDKEGKNTPRLLFKDSKTESLTSEDLVPISLDKINPKILLEDYCPNLSEHAVSVLKGWIIKHYDGLMKVWNGEISESEYCVLCAKSYHLGQGLERVFERIDYDYDTAINHGCKHQYKFYVQGFLDGMRFLKEMTALDPDVLEKLLSIYMFKEIEDTQDN